MEQIDPEQYVHEIDSPATIICPECPGSIYLDDWQQGENPECYKCEREFVFYMEEVDETD